MTALYCSVSLPDTQLTSSREGKHQCETTITRSWNSQTAQNQWWWIIKLGISIGSSLKCFMQWKRRLWWASNPCGLKSKQVQQNTSEPKPQKYCICKETQEGSCVQKDRRGNAEHSSCVVFPQMLGGCLCLFLWHQKDYQHVCKIKMNYSYIWNENM